MARRVLCCCTAALVLHLTCVTAVQRLNNINDLKRIPFGETVPRRSLKLLHWFANKVNIYTNGIVLHFNPQSDYGSHHYGNSNWLLPNRRPNYQYYTVGNLNTPGSMALPDYVRTWQSDNNGYNRARIIFSVCGQTVDRVYLTQHYGNSQDSDYDPAHTYEISADLLEQLRWRSEGSLEQLYSSHSQLRGNVGHIPSFNIGRFQEQAYRYNYNQIQHNPFYNVPAAAGQGDWVDCICDILKWALILIVMVVVLAVVAAFNTKSPHGY